MTGHGNSGEESPDTRARPFPESREERGRIISNLSVPRIIIPEIKHAFEPMARSRQGLENSPIPNFWNPMESGTDRSYTPRRGLRGDRVRPVPHGLPVGAPVRAPRARGVGGRVRHRDDARDERRVRGVPPRDGRAPARLLAHPALPRPAPARRGALLGGGVRVHALGWRAAADRGGVGEGGARRARGRTLSLG